MILGIFCGYQGWPYGQDNILHWNAAASRGVSWWRRGKGSTMGYGSIGSIGWLNIIFISCLLIKMVRWCKMTVSPRKKSWFECFRAKKWSAMCPEWCPMVLQCLDQTAGESSFSLEKNSDFGGKAGRPQMVSLQQFPKAETPAHSDQLGPGQRWVAVASAWKDPD